MRTKGDFVAVSEEEEVRKVFVNCDDSQIDEVIFRSIALRSSFMDVMEEAGPSGPRDPALLINQHESYCVEDNV
jgi:hypothetical protein